MYFQWIIKKPMQTKAGDYYYYIKIIIIIVNNHKWKNSF